MSRQTAPQKLIKGLIAILLLGLSLAPLERPAFANEEPPKDRPNFLIILVDDMRWDCLKSTGNLVVQTPTLDSLAASGTYFDRFYIPTPLCSPSRATILTGNYGHQNSLNDLIRNRAWIDFPPETPTLASRFNSAGYRTGYIGKAHLGGDPRGWGFQETPLWLPSGSSNYTDPELEVRGTLETVPGNVTHVFTDASIDFLRKRSSDRKEWLLFLSTTAPHGPYCCQSEFPYSQQATEDNPAPGLPPGPVEDFDWPSYYSSITDLDHQIARIIAELEMLGLKDKTYILFTSDNGVMGGSHGLANHKGYWYEESCRVPAILAGPGIPEKIVTHPASAVDLLPTLLELAGLPAAPSLPGASMLPLIFQDRPIRSTIHLEGDAPGAGHWESTFSFEGPTSGFKYVIDIRTGMERLYNLNNDPHEMVNLMTDGSFQLELLLELRALHTSWKIRTP